MAHDIDRSASERSVCCPQGSRSEEEQSDQEWSGPGHQQWSVHVQRRDDLEAEKTGRVETEHTDVVLWQGIVDYTWFKGIR